MKKFSTFRSVVSQWTSTSPKKSKSVGFLEDAAPAGGLLSRLLFRSRELDVDTLAKMYPPQQKFFPLSSSPHADLREMHKLITSFSSCPECLDVQDQLPPEEWNDIHAIPGGTSRREPAPKSRLRPETTCPNCGFPTHCSKEHWEINELHKSVCDQLRQWNEDEHDARSGRRFWEMSFPGRQLKDAVLNFTSWPYILTTRKFPKPLLQSPITQRHVSRVLTYPYTIASLLVNPWVYMDDAGDNAKSSSVVTDAGFHVLSSLSHAIEHSVKSAMKTFDQHRGPKMKSSFTDEPTSPLLTSDPFRIFILGPRVESQLPSFVWEQLSLTFPGVPFRLYFVGPEAEPPKISVTSNAGRFKKQQKVALSSTRVYKRPINSHVSEDESEIKITSQVLPASVNLRMEYIQSKYEDVHESFGPFKKNRDLFVFFNSGIGHFVTQESWKPAIEKILKTRCLMMFTSLNKIDQEADVEAFKADHEGDYMVLLRPTFNKFSSMRPDISVDAVHDPDQWIYCNWGLFAVQGIGSDVGDLKSDFDVESTEKKPFWSW